MTSIVTISKVDVSDHKVLIVVKDKVTGVDVQGHILDQPGSWHGHVHSGNVIVIGEYIEPVEQPVEPEPGKPPKSNIKKASSKKIVAATKSEA